jgi:hypothetical protein
MQRRHIAAPLLRNTRFPGVKAGTAPGLTGGVRDTQKLSHS